MKLPTITLLALVALTSGSALPEPIQENQDVSEIVERDVSEIVERTPKDQSGNSQIYLECNEVLIPEPGGAGGSGEGGSSYFSTNLVFNAQGQEIDPVGCYDEYSTCSNCLFAGGGLSSPTNVTACWFPPAGSDGCSIEFQYNGYPYNSQTKEPYCGHTDKFEPFSSGLKAICYFDV